MGFTLAKMKKIQKSFRLSEDVVHLLERIAEESEYETTLTAVVEKVIRDEAKRKRIKSSSDKRSSGKKD